MIKSLILIFLNLIFIATIASARPPKNMELTYDYQSKQLIINLDHVVDDISQEFIRKLVISKNDEALIEKFYRSQTNQFKFSAEISLDAEPSDVITVKAYASEGGTLTSSLTVIENEALETEIP